MDLGASLKPLLDAVASKTPTPGGGAVASWIGATGASLGLMVVAYSLGRKQDNDEVLENAKTSLENARALFLTLADEDAAAYADLSAVLKLDKSDPARADKLAASVQRAIEVPSAVAATGLNVLREMERFGPASSRYLLSDLGVAAGAVEAAINGAIWMVRANLPLVTDEERRRAQQEAISRWQSQASARRAAIDKIVTDR